MATDVAKLHGSALRDSLREAVRTAHRRRLNEAERDLFLSFIDELEVRAKRDSRAADSQPPPQE